MNEKDCNKFINSATPKLAEQPSNTKIQETQKTIVQSDYGESVFAAGLPNWDIVPPHVVVRRRRI